MGNGSAIAYPSSQSLLPTHCWRSSYSWRSIYKECFIHRGSVNSLPLQVGPECITWRWVLRSRSPFLTTERSCGKRHRSRASLAVLKALGWTNGAIPSVDRPWRFLYRTLFLYRRTVNRYTTIYTLYDLVPWNERCWLRIARLTDFIRIIAAIIQHN